jgi:hypothetical protein
MTDPSADGTFVVNEMQTEGRLMTQKEPQFESYCADVKTG